LPFQRGKSYDRHGRDRDQLARGLAALGLPLRPEAVDRVLEHAALIRKWTGSYNLVARGDLDALVGRHILDSLATHPFISTGSLLDAGSGAGFPGIPLAIAMPDSDVTLLDSSGKKTRFLRHVIRSLNLENAQAVNSRLEDYRRDEGFTAIICRAFSSLADFISGIRHLARPETRILAMKGRMPEQELDDLPGWIRVNAVERIEVPDLHAERHLVIMSIAPDIA